MAGRKDRQSRSESQIQVVMLGTFSFFANSPQSLCPPRVVAKKLNVPLRKEHSAFSPRSSVVQVTLLFGEKAECPFANANHSSKLKISPPFLVIAARRVVSLIL